MTVEFGPIIEVTATLGIQGPQGEGVPTGGTTGQVLAKASNTNLDTEWVSSGAVPPVDSVNGATGVVVLDPDDLDDTATTNKFTTAADTAKLADIDPGANANRALSSQAEAEAGTDNVKGMTPLRTAQAIAALETGGGAPEGTAVLSTGETGGSKFLREDGDGTSSWQPITGGGDMLAANNLSDLADDLTARTNLGVGIGSDVQAHSAVLDATTASFTTADESKLDGIAPGADVSPVASVNTATGAVVLDADDISDAATTNKFVTAADTTKLGNLSGINTGDDPGYEPGGTDVAVADGGTGSSTAAGARANLGLVIGTDVQAHDAVLDATTASFTTADETKLDAIEPLADVTDEANVTNALDNATLTDVGTPAATDRILLQDASDTNALKYADFSEFGGGGGGSDNTITSAANTRFDLPTNSSRKWSVILGPWQTSQDANQASSPGAYLLGLCDVRGGTYEEATVDIEIAGSSGDDIYYVIYNTDTAGMPTTVHASFGPFNVDASTGAVDLTGISIAVTAGRYLVGTFAPTANTGSPRLEGGKPALLIGNGSVVATQMRQSITTSDTGHATPQDLSSFTLGSGAGATVFGGVPNGLPHLTGKEVV